MRTRAKSGFTLPSRKLNFLVDAPNISPLPRTYRAALADPNWAAAMTDEYQALLQNDTWTLVPRPAGSHVVSGKWVFRVKYHSDGTLARYKAR